MLVLPILAACGGGGGGGDPQPPEVDLSGSWEITEVVSSSTNQCDDGPQAPYTVQVDQDGNGLTVTAPAGRFTGTISGRTVSWTGSYPEDGGTTTIRSMSLQATATSLTGSASWSWTDGTVSCSGTTQVSGRKTGGVGGAHGSGATTGELLFVCGAEVGESGWIAVVRSESDPNLEVHRWLHDETTVELPADRYAVTILAPRPDDGELAPIGRLTGIELQPGELEIVPVECDD